MKHLQQRRRSKKPLIVCVLLLLVVGSAAYWKFGLTHNTSRASGTVAATSGSGKQTAAASSFDKTTHSLTDPASLWIVVNKTRPLAPKNYTPPNLVVPNIALRSNITSTEKYVSVTMAGPLETMVAAAKQDGVHLDLESGYRSYSFQVTLYNSYVKQQGQAVADSQSARPGYSEHQTGLAADLGGTSNPSCNVEDCFSDTPEGKWLAANAYKYGFIIRYPADKVKVTGYIYEPWHIRYIGTDLSNELHNKGIETLEEFFGLPAAPDYK